MKICWQGFLAQNHSWSIVGQNICRTLIKKGHDVHLFSTNGLEFFPEDLKPNLIGHFEDNKIIGKLPENNFDMQLTYTAMHNFKSYLSHGDKNKFAIWCYEFAGKNSLPNGFAKNYRYCDKLLPPSEFAKQVFLDSGIPNESMEVIPHGIDIEKFSNDGIKFDIKTNKKFKILVNIAQPHIRKNLEGTLESYGRAFTNKDDVSLILKVVEKKVKQQFDISFRDVISNFKNKFKNHGEIKVITEYIYDIDTLYRSCDAVFSMTKSECFNFPAAEGLVAGKIIIMPKWGGHLDFLNDENSLLIKGKETIVPLKALYWGQCRAFYFEPDIDDAVEKLKFAYHNQSELKTKFNLKTKEIIQQYSWDNVVSKILNLVQ